MKQLSLIAISFFISVAAFAQEKTVSLKYRRSSLYTLMIDDSTRSHAKAIKEAFISYPVPDKFNDHNLKNRLIKTKASVTDQTPTIDNYMNTNQVAKYLVAKWFDRAESGAFDMNLIGYRGSYDASELDANIAKKTKRGTASLADAGEELIGNTFVLISDFKYTTDSAMVADTKKTTSDVKSVFNKVPGASLGFGSKAFSTSDAATKVGGGFKGYVVSTTSYLYRLDWNDSVAAVLYNEYWMDSTGLKPERKTAFDASGIFKLKFIGKDIAWAEVQQPKFMHVSEDKLIAMATKNAVDAVIAKLQTNHKEFRTKTQLLTNDPASAQIGKKEGLEGGDSYQVLMQNIDENGKTTYENVGTITVDKKQIWDNRYLAEVDTTNVVDRTLFKGGNKNKMFPGMVILQK